jgi:PadR family transcriptional regulator, regulatory protein PadR
MGTGKDKTDSVLGALNLLVLKTIASGALHGYAIAQRIGQISDDLLKVEEGSLYPALHRMESLGWIVAEWRLTETNRRARFYQITASGRKQLKAEQASWDRLARGVQLVLQA